MIVCCNIGSSSIVVVVAVIVAVEIFGSISNSSISYVVVEVRCSCNISGRW